MADVKTWLDGLGLTKYANVFEQHEVDYAALPHLDDALLGQMGLPVGPRAKLLAAIAALRARASNDPAPRPSQPRAPFDARESEGERRQITILFSDLADSTRLAARLDPEDLKALMLDYQRACKTAIDRYCGHVAQYVGDGIVAYFGWPIAQEDAAERAVRAGLDLVAAVRAIQGPEALNVRVGINTGTVVISASGHGDPSIPHGAIGDTPHIAARLQSLAAPNSVVISDATSRLVGASCEQEALGPQNLKGVAAAMHVFRVTRMHTNRFIAARARALTPFVGRRAELALLEQRWRDARAGEGQVVYVSGVPGIGKSRVVYELEQRIGQEAHFRLKFQCSPHTAHSALFPIIHGLEWQAKVLPDDSPQVKLEKIRELLHRSTDHVDRALPLWAELFSLPLTTGTQGHSLSAQQAKDQTLFLLADLLVGLSRGGAVFCLLEDAQWMDASTRELLDLIAGHIEHARILFVVTHRPAYQPRIGDHGKVSTLAIARLARHETVEMANHALHTDTVSNGVLQRILDNADAIPLYVEELARSVAETGATDVRRSPDHTDPARPTVSSVPDALRDALVTRLDRVPQGRRVAQIASVIGREFPFELLQYVSGLSADELEATLGLLIRGGILHQLERGPSIRFAFTHALLRDVAYESILKSTRRGLHAKVADTIGTISPDAPNAEPELLAYHHGEAGNIGSAIQYWLNGAHRAHRRWANLEGIEQLERAFDLVPALPEGTERDRLEASLAILHGSIHRATSGFASPEAERSFVRAIELCGRIDDLSGLVDARRGLFACYYARGALGAALEQSEALRTLGTRLGDRRPRMLGHWMSGCVRFWRGEFVEAHAELARAHALYAPDEQEAQTLAQQIDPGVNALLHLTWTRWILGHPDAARRTAEEALATARGLAQPFTIAMALFWAGLTYASCGDRHAAARMVEELDAITARHGLAYLATCAIVLRAHELVYDGDPERALAALQSAFAEFQRQEAGVGLPWATWIAALAYARLGRTDEALATLTRAFTLAARAGEEHWLAELWRLKGELLATSDPVGASSAFLEALAVARRQGARSLELRAACSLAQLEVDRGKCDAARDILAPLYGSFVEGHGTADLRAAATMLERVGALPAALE